MKNLFTKAYVWGQIWRDENGQDLIEYALVVALIAFAAIVGMNSVANGINSAFVKVATKLNSVIT
jgi:pilus assembly protein Flp/PilA